MGMRLRSRDNMTPAIAFLLYGLLLGSVASLEEKKPVHPVKKIGQCPNEVDYPKCNVDSKPERLCKSDKNCKGTEKCCLYECKFQCVPPLGDKQLSCPYFDTNDCKLMLVLPNQCQHDNQCTGTKRCCNFCSNQCTNTVKARPGLCPTVKDLSYSGVMDYTECRTDTHCNAPLKCCRIEYKMQCTKPL